MNNSFLYTTLLLLWLGHFLVDFMIGIWPVYKTMASLDLATAGIMVGFCAFAGEGMQLVFGSLSDRGYRKMLILSGVFMTASSVFFAYTENYTLLFILLLVNYLGSGAFHPSAVGLIGSLPSPRKGLLVTIFATGGSLGMASSQFIFSNIYETFSGHTIFLIIPTLALLAFSIFYRFIGVQKSKDAAAGKKIDFRAYLDCFKNRSIVLLFISQVCNQTIMWGTNFLLPDVLYTRGYDSWLCYGGGHFFYIIGGVLTLIPAGYLADKYSSRSVILIATILGLGFFYLFVLNPELSPTILLSVLFMMGACLWVVNPVSVALGNRLMPDKPGVVSALLMGLVWCISESTGPAGGGLLTKLFEEDAPAKVLMCMGVLLVVNIFVVLKLPKHQPSPAMESVASSQ